MNNPIIQLTDTIPSIKNSINRLPLRRGFLLIPLAVVCFALSPLARAVSPAPDGGYPGKNTAEGTNALLNNTSGGIDNTAIGFEALEANTIGLANTAVGSSALLANTTGAFNTATGRIALLDNTTGFDNTATGYAALANNATGSNNTANGVGALFSNTTGVENTATGTAALNLNTAGSKNTANGLEALFRVTTGSFNIALGYRAGFDLTTGDHNIDIGNKGLGRDANTIRIGKVGTQTNTNIAGISGATVAGGVGVIIDSSGHLGTVQSSARYKDEIKPMSKASEAILALKPVTFRYKEELDPEGIPQFGLVAEEVEKIAPDLVTRDEEGKPYTVRYEAVNAMLLNEFLKEHKKVAQLEAKLAQQQKDFTERLKEQDAKIQKVSDRVELSKPAPQVVGNNQ